MDLVLWRHAHAETLEDNALNKSDIERQLTPKGQKQAAKMALWLSSTLPDKCKILVSPAQRTIQTASALNRPFKIVEEIGTTSTAEEILTACNWPNSRVPVLIVGHQPQLGWVISKLLPDMNNVAIQKGNVWWISCKGDAENPQVFLKAVMTPELVVK